MTNQIQALMTEIYEVNKKEKESELKALQAQINPHFLYNTLDALYWMSDDDNVSEIISSFVITSYSIHYTKLYENILCLTAERYATWTKLSI